MFPSYLLSKVYVAGSLHNSDDGFEFSLRNNIDTGSLGSVKSLLVDGVEIGQDKIVVQTSSGERPAVAITFRSPMLVRKNSDVIVKVKADKLSPGAHKMVLSISILEAGKLDFKFEDVVNE
jgi:hypothetical protein